MKINPHSRADWVTTALVALSSATLVTAEEKPTNTLGLATNQLRLELSNASAVRSTNLLTLSGVGHSPVTENGFFDLTNKPSVLWIAPTQAAVAPEAAHQRMLSNKEAAEAINAAAMRDYQRRFELKLKEPTTPVAPNLYPAQTQRILEIR